LQSEKQFGPRISTDEGMQMDESDEHAENALLPIPER
jgi:hypothetical protein